VIAVGPFLDQSAQAISSSIEVNSTVCSPDVSWCAEMVKRRSGHIINIASLPAMVAVPANHLRRNKIRSRRAVHRDGRRIRPAGVKVTAVLPTFTNTELISGTSPSAAQSRSSRPRSPPRSSKCSTSRNPSIGAQLG